MQALELEALVRAGVFATREQRVQEAVRALFAARPHLRIEAAVQLYKEGHITLGRAAEMAGLSRWELRDLLADRGVTVEVEVPPAEEMEQRLTTLTNRTGHSSR